MMEQKNWRNCSHEKLYAEEIELYVEFYFSVYIFFVSLFRIKTISKYNI